MEKKQRAAAGRRVSTKKKILTVAVTFLLALATVLIWMAIVSVDPFRYLTISFEGAQPYLVPKAEVPKGAPAGPRII